MSRWSSSTMPEGDWTSTIIRNCWEAITLSHEYSPRPFGSFRVHHMLRQGAAARWNRWQAIASGKPSSRQPDNKATRRNLYCAGPYWGILRFRCDRCPGIPSPSQRRVHCCPVQYPGCGYERLLITGKLGATIIWIDSFSLLKILQFFHNVIYILLFYGINQFYM